MRASDPSITDTLRAGDEDAGGCYTIPMGLCYGKRDSGHDARTGTDAPGRSSPLGAGGMGGCKSVTDLLRHSLAHRFSLKSAGAGGVGQWSVGASASLWQTCSDTVLQRRVAMKVAGLAVWGAAQRRTKLTDEQVPLYLSTLASALPLEQGTIGPDYRHRPKHFCPLCPLVDGVDRVDRGGHGGRLVSWGVFDGHDGILIVNGDRSESVQD